MAFVNRSSLDNPDEVPPELALACDDYRRYLRLILEPAMEQLESDAKARRLRLHQVFGANLFLAHPVDYIQKVRNTAGISESRSTLVAAFDKLLSVDGARFGNRKFELIDAVNNALKHIRLEPARYKHLEERYGSISFQCLVEEDGDVLCILDGYRFDYVRVVVRPSWRALKSLALGNVPDFVDLACDTQLSWTSAERYSDDDWDDPIERMIEFCNPSCDDCGEQESDCRCSHYVYDGEQGRFESAFRATFNFDEVMSRISGAYRRERD